MNKRSITNAKNTKVGIEKKSQHPTRTILQRINWIYIYIYISRGTGATAPGGIQKVSAANDNPEKLQYYYHSDHLGSSSLITDLDGNVAQHIEYVPFGEVFIEEKNSTWNTPYKFNGKELDEETGLYYYGARYLDPRTSVWISVDPLAETTSHVGSYVYCHGNPVNFIDVMGLYDDKASAQKDQKIATTIFGSHRVSDVHNASTSENPNYRFSIFKEGQDKNTHGLKGEAGVSAYKPDMTVDNRSSLNNYVDKNSNPNFNGVPFRFLDYSSIKSDSYFGGAINTDHNSYYRLLLGDQTVKQHFKHEFGHSLQEKYYGKAAYLRIAAMSIKNLNNKEMMKNNYFLYNRSWTEASANTFSYYYFRSEQTSWDMRNYPINRNSIPMSIKGQMIIDLQINEINFGNAYK